MTELLLLGEVAAQVPHGPIEIHKSHPSTYAVRTYACIMSLHRLLYVNYSTYHRAANLIWRQARPCSQDN